MRAGPLDVFDTANPAGRKTAKQRSEAEKIGLAMMLNRGIRRATSYFDNRIFPAIALNQIQFYFNDNGAVVGYVVWAFLTPEVADRLSRCHDERLHISEWNEGEELWILDIVAPRGHFWKIKSELFSVKFSQFCRASYSRNVGGKVICAQFSRVPFTD